MPTAKSAKPAAKKPAAKPPVKAAPKVAPKTASKATPNKAAPPAPKVVAKKSAKPAPKVAAKAPAKPPVKSAAKAAPAKAAKAPAKAVKKIVPVTKKAPSVPLTPPKKTAALAVKTAAKPVSKPASKPAPAPAKAAVKPVAKPVTKVAAPAAKAPAAKAPAAKPKAAAKGKDKAKPGLGLDELIDIEDELEGEPIPVAPGEKVKPLRMKISKAKERALMKEFGLDETILSEEDLAKRRQRLKALIKLGKTRGYLTHVEISDHLPDKLVDAETMEAVITTLNDLGVAVYEQTPDTETLLLNNNVATAATEAEAEEEAEAALSTVDSEFGRTQAPLRPPKMPPPSTPLVEMLPLRSSLP